MKRRAAILGVLALAACGKTELPPHGEVLLVVDTDLPVPALAGRLRVDVFSEEGTWLESRDIGRSDPRDWPASFSVFSDDDTRVRSALVRLRVYPEGAVSPYKGERGVQATPFVEPPVARDVDELCANAPELPLGGSITRRAGDQIVTAHAEKPSCPRTTKGGAIAARVTINAAGTYRFSVANAFPFLMPVTLSLRSTCADPNSQLTCRSERLQRGFDTTGHFPRFDQALEPGTYFLVATSQLASPADITLDAYPVDAPLPPDQRLTVKEEAPTTPRLEKDGEDRTPSTEPSTTATVDRLVLVHIEPNARGTARVVLRGACAGVRARLAARPYEVDLASASTCTEIEGTTAPVVASPVEPNIVRGTSSVQGTFAPGEACPPSAPDTPRACIAGGVFLLGTRVISPFTSTILGLSPAPQRIAVMPRFSIDRHEVTVARVRAAIAKGFAIDPTQIAVNDTGFPLSVNPRSLPRFDVWCTWSSAPLGREDYPVSCVTWNFARSFCQFEGGDLPTEAEWEYVAGAAGQPFESDFPWGSDAPPLCERGVLFRYQDFLGNPQACGTYPGPAPITESAGGDGRAPDATALGVFGLTGGVMEWVKDSPAGYDSPCWMKSGLRSPQCWEEHAPWRTIRGGSWAVAPLPMVQRNAGPPTLAGQELKDGDELVAIPDPTVGFRCAYHEVP